MLLDQVASAAHVGQCRETEEVDLEQANRLAGFHRELRDLPQRHRTAFFAVVVGAGFGQAMQRQVFAERTVGDDHARRVSRSVAADALQFRRRVDHLLDFRHRVVHLLEFGVVLDVNFDRLLLRLGRDQADGLVDQRQIDIERAPHVADGGFRAQRPEGDDRRDFILAVLACRVVDHLAPAVVGVVEVDIGHTDTTGVEEALEQQVIFNRVDVGDAEAVSDDAARARTAHVPPDVGVAGELAQIPDDQEVGVEAHLLDDAQFVVQPLAQVGVVGIGCRSASRCPFPPARAGMIRGSDSPPARGRRAGDSPYGRGRSRTSRRL